MTHAEKAFQDDIKEACEFLFRRIQLAKDSLEENQALCKHPRKREGKYSWRIGCIDDAMICSDCGKFLYYLHHSVPAITTYGFKLDSDEPL